MFGTTLFNSKKDPVAVIIPIYKSHLNYYELISFDRCLDTLSDHKIVIVAPEGLSISSISRLGSFNVSIECFQKAYFRDIEGYNRLLLSLEFYERFIHYEYILIHQLDAFIFSDDLLHWCDTGFDYIGAPWMDFRFASNYFEKTLRKICRLMGFKEKKVGNGGLSLRKVTSFINVLRTNGERAETWQVNEDIFWSIDAPKVFPSFRIPDVKLAMRFSVEVAPKECFKSLDGLPFGCHGWEKYDIDFWRPIFKELGYVI